MVDRSTSTSRHTPPAADHVEREWRRRLEEENETEEEDMAPTVRSVLGSSLSERPRPTRQTRKRKSPEPSSPEEDETESGDEEDDEEEHTPAVRRSGRRLRRALKRLHKQRKKVALPASFVKEIERIKKVLGKDFGTSAQRSVDEYRRRR